MILAHCPSPSPTCQHPSLTDLPGPRSEAEAADFLLPGTVSSPPGSRPSGWRRSPRSLGLPVALWTSVSSSPRQRL